MRARRILCSSALSLLSACDEPASVTAKPEPMEEPVDSCEPDPEWSQGLPDYPPGLHVVEHHVEDALGNTVALRGVNRSGTEYRCVQGFGFFEIKKRPRASRPRPRSGARLLSCLAR